VGIEYLPCGHPLEAAVTQLRLHHAHRPWFDGRPRRWKARAYLKLTAGRLPRLAVVHTPRADGAVYLGPFPGVAPARFVRSAIEAALPLRRGTGDVVALVRRGLSGEAEAILGPLADRVEALTAAGRAGDAAFAQEQLRALSGALRRQAVLDGLQASGRITLDVAGHQVELDGGRLVGVDQRPAPLPLPGNPEGRTQAGWVRREEADELLAVGRWLRREARAGRVTVGGPVEAPQAAALAAVLEGVEGGSACDATPPVG
jgi:excinuclease UvrABC nuclease subunit